MANPSPRIDLGIYRPVPATGPGVCQVCHSGAPPGGGLCGSCAVTRAQVSRPAAVVVPVSLYRTSGPLWRVLRDYKDGDPATRARLTRQLAAVLDRFTARHLPCVARLLGDAPVLVATVPSTRPEARGRHRLETAVAAVPALAARHAPLLAPGPGAADHGQADDEAFTVARRLRGERVLLIDDTFTTGARAQSAASALSLNGAGPVAVLTVGRVIWPDWNDNCRQIWDAACATPFSFDTCCLCA